MPVESVHRSVLIDDLALSVSAWRYICDRCGTRETFPDHPMPEGRSECEASRKGWRISVVHDEECHCPTCCAVENQRAAVESHESRQAP